MAASATEPGRRFSRARQVKARAMGIRASAVMCGPSPYRINTPSLTGTSGPESIRMSFMNSNDGDISAVAAAPSQAAPRDRAAARISRYTPAMPTQ